MRLAYLGYFAFFSLYTLLCWYMGAYTQDGRIVQEIFKYEYVPIGKLRFICLHKHDPEKKQMIRKITRDREIVSFILFGIVVIFGAVSSFMIGENKSLNAIGVLIPVLLAIIFTALQLFALNKIEKRCKAIAASNKTAVEMTEKELARRARNIMRERYKGENKTYSVEKEEKHTFWYDHAEYHLCVDGNKEEILAKQQKYRYSEIVETEWLTGRI